MESLIGLKYLSLIFEFMIKSSLVLAGSFLLFCLFRKKSASMRYFLLSVSLISLLLLPFLSTFVTGWQTQLLPSWQIQGYATFNVKEGSQNKGTIYYSKQEDSSIQANAAALSRLENASIQGDGAVPLKTSDLKTILGMSLIALWIAGLAFLLIRIFVGLYGAHRLTREGKKISAPFWQLLLQRFLDAVSIRRKISLLSHDQIRTPLTWGIFKPVVIMPSRAENWNRDECSSALFHELSHVKRSDFLFKILARTSCAVYWFNPLTWLVFRLMREEQEKACDELVLKVGVKPSMYAANLLSIQKAGQIQQNPPASVLGAVGKSQLNERLLAILKHRLKPKEVKMKTKILLSFSIMAAITFIGLARPAQSEASNPAISLDHNEFMTEIQNSSPVEDIQEKQKKKQTEEKKKGEISWILKDGKKVHIIEVPEIHIKKEIKVPKSFTIHIEDEKKTLYVSPDITLSAVPVPDIHPFLHLKIEEKKLREKLEGLRDKLEKIKELQGEVEEDEAREEALKAVEEVLKELREKLEIKNKQLEDIQVQIKTDIKHKLENKIKNLKSFDYAFVWTQDEHNKKIIGIAEKDAGFQIIIKNKLDSENNAKYEKILEKIKKDLPEDYKAEYEIDEEENTITYKITTEKRDEESKIEIKELLNKIVDELKKEEKKS